tara:strand:+ start:25967 stop:26605 length:639 start_codon:yes stop_codon:yes gene_type:complete
MINNYNDIILAGKSMKTIKIVDGVFWLILVFSSFNELVEEISIFHDFEIGKLGNYVFSFELIKLLTWTMLIVGLYLIVKFILIKVFANTSIAFNFFIGIMSKKELKVSYRNVYFHKYRALDQHVSIMKKVTSNVNSETFNVNLDSLKAIFGLALKLLLLLIINFHLFLSNSLVWLWISGGAMALIILLICMYGIILKSGMRQVKYILEQFSR